MIAGAWSSFLMLQLIEKKVKEIIDGDKDETLDKVFLCPLDLILEEPSFDPCYPIRAVRGH